MNDLDVLKLYFKDEALKKAIDEYESGVPAAYIIGEWEFCGDRYLLNRDCLIPRCDTERVVEAVLSRLPEDGRLADLCTGTGCIAISTLKRKPFSTGIAVDISEGALSCARKNAEINGIGNRLEIICGDVFKSPLGDSRFDVIVSNPPYIPAKDMAGLDEYVKKEPAAALDGGEEGMDFYDHIIRDCEKNLTESGVFIFEIGYNQEELIKAAAEKSGFSCKVTKDYSGNPRVALLKKLS